MGTKFLGNDTILCAIIEMLNARSRASDHEADVRTIGEMNVSELGLDSLDLLQFVVDLEDRLEIVVDADDIPVDGTLAELADFLSVLKKH